MPSTKDSEKNDKDDNSDRASDVYLSEESIASQKEKDWPLLDPQRRAFAEAYCFNNYNHRAAAEEAGFNPDRGISLKREPLIRAFIADVQDKLHLSNIVTRDFIDAKLDELYDMAIGDVETDHVNAKSGASFTAKKFHGTLALDIIKQKASLNNVISSDEDDDGAGNDAEIHFHVKPAAAKVKVTRGGSKSNSK